MKYLALVLSLILSLVLIPGCSNFSTINEATSDPPNEERIVFYEQQGNITGSGSLDAVCVYINAPKTEEYASDVFLSIASNNDLLISNLGCWEYRVLKYGELLLSDINKDGTDEILLCMEVTGNGGVLAQIYDVHQNNIVLLADLNQLDINLEKTYNTNCEMLLTNPSVGFMQTLDISDQFPSENFDNNGKFTGEETKLRYHINALSIEDGGSNEYPQIVCEYSVSLSSFLGTLKTTAHFDPESATLVLDEISYIDERQRGGQGDGSPVSSQTDKIDHK